VVFILWCFCKYQRSVGYMCQQPRCTKQLFNTDLLSYVPATTILFTLRFLLLYKYSFCHRKICGWNSLPIGTIIIICAGQCIQFLLWRGIRNLGYDHWKVYYILSCPSSQCVVTLLASQLELKSKKKKKRSSSPLSLLEQYTVHNSRQCLALCAANQDTR